MPTIYRYHINGINSNRTTIPPAHPPAFGNSSPSRHRAQPKAPQPPHRFNHHSRAVPPTPSRTRHRAAAACLIHHATPSISNNDAAIRTAPRTSSDRNQEPVAKKREQTEGKTPPRMGVASRLRCTSITAANTVEEQNNACNTFKDITRVQCSPNGILLESK